MDIIREHNIDLDDKRHLIYIRRRLTCKLDLNVTPFSYATYRLVGLLFTYADKH